MVVLNGSCITALETCISFCQGVALWQAKAGPKAMQGDKLTEAALFCCKHSSTEITKT